jgi:hypothetical protein
VSFHTSVQFTQRVLPEDARPGIFAPPNA